MFYHNPKSEITSPQSGGKGADAKKGKKDIDPSLAFLRNFVIHLNSFWYMTRIILEVPQDKDLDLLLALLERLDIRVVQKMPGQEQPAAAKDDRAFILKGLPARKDMETFVQEFEESRKDRPLPGREN